MWRTACRPSFSLLPTLGVTTTTTWFTTLVDGLVRESHRRSSTTIQIALDTFLANKTLQTPECIEALLKIFMAPQAANVANLTMLVEMWKRTIPKLS
jgi:hypothetical protein